MRRLLLIVPVLLLCVSCKFVGGRQQPAVSEAEQSIPEQAETVPETAEPEPWYNHDFSLVYVQHKYATPSRPAPDLDETYLITRLGDRLYLQYTLKGVIQKTSIYEATPEGYHETIYKRGKVDWEHAFDNQSLNSEVRHLLRKKYPVAVDFPEGLDLRKAQEGTCCGRLCWIAEIVEEESGGKATTTYFIDKEYRFFYHATQVGVNGFGQEINMTPFEVTYFTDKPTAEDIPDPKSSNNPVDALKKQLQGQLERTAR